jgi:methyl-accepting chemotaxis protein
MMKFKSIKTKLTLFFGGLTFIICIGLGGISYLASSNALSSSINESIATLAKESTKVVQLKVESELNALAALAETDAIKKDTLTLDEKLKLLDAEVKRNGDLRINIADVNGNAKNTLGATSDISSRDYFKKALAGEKAVSDPLVSKTDNTMIIAYAVPIKDGNEVKGVLVGIRDGYVLCDLINDIKYGKSGTAFMINSQGTSIAHTNKENVTKGDNIFENLKTNPELQQLADLQKKMTKGEDGIGEYTYKGVTKHMAYAPVSGTTWSLAVTVPKSDFMEKVNTLFTTIVFISIAFVAAGIVIIFLLASSISKPIKEASEYLNIVATGDFTGTVPPRLLKMNDETGLLANAIHAMQQSIRNTLVRVAEESSNVSEMLAGINSKMEQLNTNIEEVSATTEELSAGTEETAASTEEMNATSQELENAVESIATKAQEGSVIIGNVYRMSEEMKRNSESSKESALEIFGRNKNDLQNAIEQSKAVNQIGELSEAILSITSQTNMLALNAAIEAARAGEAGKGFAVVAEEIRKLAEDSKNTVTRIQQVTKVILEAVNNLSASSGEIMEFIDKKVLNDYDNLVKSSEEYSRNSTSINDIVTDFSVTSEELLASIQSIVKVIDEISHAVNEEARGATNIAQGSAEITQMSNDVIELAGLAKVKSDLLSKEVSSFRV